MTVSRYFNDPGMLSDETRSKVEDAIESHQYVPNAPARSLVKGKTKTLSLVVADVTNPFFTQIARAAEDTVQKREYTLMLGNTDETAEKERRYLRVLVSRRVDGVILSPAIGESKHVEYLVQQDIPVVLIDRKVPGADVDTVVSDSYRGGYRLTNHLIDRGYRNIAFIGGEEGVSTLEERLDGYRTAMDEEGRTPTYQLGAYTRRSGEMMVEKLLQEQSRPNAIIAANNFVAIGAIQACRRHDINVPQDLALASIGDLGPTAKVKPFLTAIQHSVSEMGRIAAEMLLERIEGYEGPPREKKLPVTLKVRKSTPPVGA